VHSGKVEASKLFYITLWPFHLFYNYCIYTYAHSQFEVIQLSVCICWYFR
ncbi:unnamed protein product, partial [Callosobruchus maculatus]